MRILSIISALLLCPILVNGQLDLAYLHTGLPVCYIQTANGTAISRTEFSDATIVITENEDTTFHKTPILIEGRGNATWGMPKKPYKFKFQESVLLPGIPKGRKFALMANYYDASLMRTAVGLKVGKLLRFPWVPSCQYVELVLNGEYQGNYLITEAIEAKKTKIDIDKQSGFILEYIYESRLNPQRKHFFSSRNHWLFEFKDPDGEDVSEEQKAYAENAINEFEHNLYSNRRNWKEYVDVESFVQWYYWKNILRLEECNRYYVKDDNTSSGKIKMGPLWDFDWSIGLAGGPRYLTAHYLESKLYFSDLAKERSFMEEVARLHFTSRKAIEHNLLEYYDELQALLNKSQELNHSKWNTFSNIPYVGMTWEEAIERDKDWLVAHLKYLDRILSKYYDQTGIAQTDNGYDCKPSYITLSGYHISTPAHKQIYIQTDGRKARKVLAE